MNILRVNDKEYVMYMSTNAICILETLVGDVREIDFDNPSYTSIRALLYSCLWEKHKISLEQIGKIIDDYTLIKENNLTTLLTLISDEITSWSNARFKEESTNEETTTDKKK